MNNFNLRKFLSENKLTPTSKIIKEEADRYDGKLPKILFLISNLKSKITNRPPKTYVKDGLLFVSAEDGNYFADYYPEMSDDPFIDPRLEKIADRYDTYWEWEDAGSIVLFPLNDLDENIMDQGNSDSTSKGMFAVEKPNGEVVKHLNSEKEAQDYIDKIDPEGMIDFNIRKV
jgi:hypothetical protein